LAVFGAEQILATLWRWRLTFLLTSVLVMASVAAATFALPKVYGSSTYLWVTSASESASDYEATQTNQVLNKTYAELLQTASVANAVAEQLPFRMTGEQVSQSVTIAPITQSQLIRISAEASTAERARIIAETYANVFVARVSELDSRSGIASRVTVAEPPLAISSPLRPRPKLYLLIGSILALCCGAAAALVRQRFDHRLDIDAATTELFDLPILARVPQAPAAGTLPASPSQARSPATEQLSDAFRFLLTNLAFANGGSLPTSLAVVSAEPGEGKSTCCVGIGAAAMEIGVRTVLVDADLRRPRLAAMLGGVADNAAGFSDLLQGSIPLALNEVTHETPSSALRFVPSGALPANPVPLLGKLTLSNFERRAKSLFDLIVYDTPPLSVGPDASLVAVSADAAILVINSRKTRSTAVLQAVEQLRRSKATVLGVVVNRVEDGMSGSYYYRHSGRGAENNGAGSHRTAEGKRPATSTTAAGDQRQK
jgi:capsular exopolysaccharide synthesis family protein